MNLKKYKKSNTNLKKIEKKFDFYGSSNIRKNIKCAIPVITNKIKLYAITGYIVKTHKKNTNLNQTYSFVFEVANSKMVLTTPAHCPVFRTYHIK